MNKYPSYKESGVEWIGEIPSGWDKSKLKYHTSFTGGFPFDSFEITNEPQDYPIIRIGNVTSGKVDVYFEGKLDERHPIVKTNQYIMSLTGDFSIRQWKNQDSLLNQRCGLIESRDGTNIRLFFYQLPFQFFTLERTKTKAWWNFQR